MADSLTVTASAAFATLRRPRLLVFAAIGLMAAPGYFPHVAAESAQAPAQAGPVGLPSFSGLVERVAPAVVSIRVKANPSAIATRDGEEDDKDASSGKEANPFKNTPLERFFDGPELPGSQPKKGIGAQAPVQGQGSGFFISADGYIVTNNHVVEGAIKVEAVIENGDSLQARIVGTDSGTDLALLKVDGKKAFPFVPLGRSDVKPGDWVIAIGNPFGLGGTVTAGIVSARGRDIGMGAYDNFVQIDAPVNKGNSGGPAFNQAGEVIGVNTAIFSPSGGSAGIAFAIPAKTVEQVVAQLKAKGRVTRGWLGVQVQPLTPELADSMGLARAKGALVSLATPGSPAEAGGIRRGDVIVKIADEDIQDSRDLARKVASLTPDTPVKINVLRDGTSTTISVRIAEMKDEAKAEPVERDRSRQSEFAPLGLSVAPSDGKDGLPRGLAVLEINPAGKGADAGLVQGDVILSANGAAIANPQDLEAALEAASASGKKHALTFIQRGGTQVFLALPAGES